MEIPWLPSSCPEHPGLTCAALTTHTQLRTCARFNGQLWIPGAFDRWELIQAQELHGKLRIKENAQRLNSDIGTIAAWLEKTEAELEALRLAEPPSDVQEMALRVKKLQVSGSPGGGERKPEQTYTWVPNKQIRPGFGVAGSMQLMCVERSSAFPLVRIDVQVSLYTWKRIYWIIALLRCGSDPKGCKDLDFRSLRRCW